MEMTEKTREEIKDLIWQILEQYDKYTTTRRIVKIEIKNSAVCINGLPNK